MKKRDPSAAVSRSSLNGTRIAISTTGASGSAKPAGSRPGLRSSTASRWSRIAHLGDGWRLRRGEADSSGRRPRGRRSGSTGRGGRRSDRRTAPALLGGVPRVRFDPEAIVAATAIPSARRRLGAAMETSARRHHQEARRLRKMNRRLTKVGRARLSEVVRADDTGERRVLIDRRSGTRSPGSRRPARSPPGTRDPELLGDRRHQLPMIERPAVFERNWAANAIPTITQP